MDIELEKEIIDGKEVEIECIYLTHEWRWMRKKGEKSFRLQCRHRRKDWETSDVEYSEKDIEKYFKEIDSMSEKFQEEKESIKN